MTRAEYELLKELAGRPFTWAALPGRPEPNDWKTYDVLISKCELLGAGSGRTSYLVHVEGRGPFVLKIAQDETEADREYDGLDGTFQNAAEARTYAGDDRPEWLAHIYDSCPRGRWVEMEWILKPHDPDSQRGIINYIEAHFTNMHAWTVKQGLRWDEIANRRHWGLRLDGTLACFDYGAVVV